ncbi:MAG: GNAT family N-acetyltransferase [Trueperaceae bacterium]|nr:GNAT family N-acetyltransferase [Trueperaceae bacterium]
MTPLERLEAGMREAARHGRTVLATPGFAACLHPTSAHPFLSVAVPDGPDREDWPAALQALAATFAAHERAPRIEAFAELRPGLLAAADAAGWRRAMTAPVMVLDPADLAPAPPATGVVRTLDPDDDARLEAALRGQHLAFGGTAGDPGELDWLPSLRDGLRRGSVRAVAVDVDGRPVAGAVLQYGGGLAELAGVWTHPDARRRGHARGACHALLVAAFADGLELAWLSAAEGALRLYEALGFVRVGTQVNLEAP